MEYTVTYVGGRDDIKLGGLPRFIKDVPLELELTPEQVESLRHRPFELTPFQVDEPAYEEPTIEPDEED